MDRLIAELQRLFLASDAAGNAFPADTRLPEGGLLLEPAPDGRQRVFCIALCRPADWEYAAAIHRGVQEILDLPAPLVSVDGQGFRLWFSLAEPVSREQGQSLMAGVLARFAPDLPATRVRAATDDALPLPPGKLGDSERWTAFIDPSMGSMFLDEAWLEMPPNLDKQADLLAGFSSAKPSELEQALARLAPHPASASPARAAPLPDSPPPTTETLALTGHYTDPRSFLLAVMNDPQASAQQRIEAAKALMPYYGYPQSR